MCIHSKSRMKFSYCRSVRRKPVGLPVVMIMLSLTKKVSGAQLTLTQPERSLPLKRGTKPSSPARASVTARRNVTSIVKGRMCAPSSCILESLTRVDGRHRYRTSRRRSRSECHQRLGKRATGQRVTMMLRKRGLGVRVLHREWKENKQRSLAPCSSGATYNTLPALDLARRHAREQGTLGLASRV